MLSQERLAAAIVSVECRKIEYGTEPMQGWNVSEGCTREFAPKLDPYEVGFGRI